MVVDFVGRFNCREISYPYFPDAVRFVGAFETRGQTTFIAAPDQQNCVGDHREGCSPPRDFVSVATGQSRRPLKSVRQHREPGVVRGAIHRVGPLAGLTLGLVAMVGWIGLLGYVAIKLF